MVDLAFTQSELQRYSRHLGLAQVGPEGQQRLKRTRVLLIGLGGLGSPAALYLAAAGVGTLGLVEFDRIERSNLQRQILYSDISVGKAKLTQATERLRALNPDIQVIPHAMRLDADNALDLFSEYDLILDGSDNFTTRYLVNDAAFFCQKPLVYASIFQFEGQIALFHPAHSPCYRCLYPAPPAEGVAPNCESGGVLGVLPGLMGTLQATETIKFLLGLGQSLLGRLLLVDPLNLDFQTLNIPRNPACALCGENPQIKSLVATGARACAAPVQPQQHWSPERLQAALHSPNPPLLLDVREPHEYALGHLPAQLTPLHELAKHMSSLPRDREIVMYCKSGQRSLQALNWLQEQGFNRVGHLAGGLLSWTALIDPNFPLA